MRRLLPLALPAVLLAADPDLTLTADLEALRTVAPVTSPTRAWAGTPAWAHLRDRLEAAHRVDASLPPVVTLLDTAQRLALARQDGVWAVEAPAAGPAWVAWAGTRPAPGLAPAAEPVAWTWQAHDALGRCARAGWELPFHDWRGATAQIRGTWTVAEDTWMATTRLTTTARPALLPIGTWERDPAALVQVAVAVDPDLLALTLVRNLRPGHRRFLEERLGRPLGDLAALLDGQVRFHLAPGPLLPVASLAFGLRPGISAGPLVVALGDSFRGEPTTLPGAERAQRLDTPVGPWFAACSPGWLVLGNDAGALAAALAVPPVPAEGELVAEAHADLPALVRRFLPLGLAAWDGMPLVRDPLPDLAVRLTEVVAARIQAGESLAGGLEPGSSLHLRQGPIVRTWTLAEPVRQALVTFLAGPGPLEDRLAVYGPVAEDERLQVVVRTATGWLVLTDAARGFTTPISAEAAIRRLRDLGTARLVVGRPLADLVAVERPPVPRLDAACLPPPEVLAAGLAPWRLQVRRTDDGLVAEERGVPLANLMILGLALAAAAIPEPAPVAAPVTEL